MKKKGLKQTCSIVKVCVQGEFQQRWVLLNRGRMSFKDQFPDWEDFPTGLRVLVVENGDAAAANIGELLEDCGFHAITFSSGAQALQELQAAPSSFHVALVEATMTQEGVDAFDLKKASIHLPVMLMSGAENLMLMTQSVTMGAVDFVQKPLTVDKIKDRNIWMHVVRKAHKDSVKLVKPGRELSSECERSAPLVKVKQEPHGAEDVATSSGDNHSASPGHAAGGALEGALERTRSVDRNIGTPASQKVKLEQTASPISSSPQNSDVTNVAPKSEAEDADTQRSPGGDAEFSFREGGDGFEGFGIYDQNGLIDVKLELDGADCLGGAVVDADGHTDGDLCLADSFLPLDTLELNLDPMGGGCGEIHNRELEEEDARMLAEIACIAEDSPDSCAGPGPYSDHSGDGSLMRHDSLISFDGSVQSDGDTGHDSDGTGGTRERSSKRSKKMDWSPEMHRRFVDAVEKIGVDKAIPSKILDHMGVTNLTRHNVASHLQKYRTHRKHMLQSKEGEASNLARRPAESAQWTRARRDGTAWLGVTSHQPPIQPRPTQMPLPPLHAPHMGPPLHVWGHPTLDHSGGHMWHAPHMGMPSPPWMSADGMAWQHPSETWGHPTAPHLAGGWAHGPPLMMKGGIHPTPGNPWVHPPPLMIKMGGPGQGGVSDDGLGMPLYSMHPMQHSNVAAAATAAAMQGPPELNPPKEILDAAISEALANPYSSLPLGLNPPSMEGVLAELQKNGDGMDLNW